MELAKSLSNCLMSNWMFLHFSALQRTARSRLAAKAHAGNLRRYECASLSLSQAVCMHERNLKTGQNTRGGTNHKHTLAASQFASFHLFLAWNIIGLVPFQLLATWYSPLRNKLVLWYMSECRETRQLLSDGSILLAYHSHVSKD